MKMLSILLISKTILILIIISGVIAFLLVGILSIIGMSRLARYRQDMIFLETVVDHWIVSKENYYTILKLFADIRENDQDEERTELAWRRFVKKFAEFSPVEVAEELLTVAQN